MSDTTRVRFSLDGAWRLTLDPADRGRKDRWFERGDAPDSMEVQVPSVWDLWVPDYDGVGWYYRAFEWEAVPPGRMVELQFEAADYFAEVWLNGVALGAHEGGYTPFAFPVTDALRAGTNHLWVRIVDPHGPEGYGPFRPRQIPSSKEGGYWSFAGIWGPVCLESKPVAHIQDVFIEPDIRRKRITVTVQTSEPGIVRLAIEGTPYGAEIQPGRHAVDFPEFAMWSPDSPKLYTLRCELLKSGAVSDRLDVRFGMREFTVKDNRFFLNNRPIFVKGVLHQPDYPRTIAAPVDAAMARRELELAKKAGFNLVRLHIKTPPRITLDLCDEIGLLAYEEPPIGWIEKSQYMKDRCEREVREMILRDRNHPSIVIWGMLNETGNAGYITNGGAQTIKDDLCRLARSLDPSRIVVDDSGGVNASREPARFMLPYREELEPYDDLHIYQRAPVDRDIELYYAYSGDPNRLYFLSEFGFGGMEDLVGTLEQYGEDRTRLKDARFIQAMLDAARDGFAERNLDRVFGDFAGFMAAARDLQCDAAQMHVDACRMNPKLAGYCYTQLCDAGHEFCAGVLDRWRRPKPVFETFSAIQSKLRPLISIPRTNLVPREEVPVTLIMANEDQLEGKVDLSLQVVGPTNQVLWKKKRSLKLPRHGRELWEGSVGASGSPGIHRFIVRIMQGMKCLAENGMDLHVFDPVESSGIEVHILDPQEIWTKRCAVLATPGTVQAPLHVIPPLANTIRAYPDNDLAQILAQVKGGAVALFFAPPDDWNDLADRIDPGLRATNKDAVGAFLGMYHYVKLHPVFEGLPARGLMRQPYRNVVAPKTFVETGDEDIAGTFDTTPIAAGQYMMGETRWWGSDILVRRHGAGRVVFTHLRILENLGADPVADRLFVNLIRHFARRSVPSAGIVPLDQKAVEWMRRERNEATRRWMVIGPFPNWGGKGHATPYPPEETIDFDAIYPGWYAPVTWKAWHARRDDGFVVDLQQAFTPVYEYYPRFDNGTGYAYSEFFSDKRDTATVRIGLQDATKIWVNGRLIHESTDQIPHDQFKSAKASCAVKQGRNTVLVKVSKIPGPFKFSFDLAFDGNTPPQIKWWR
ncbi:MAG TPA: glycoside hydrolase family 2 TIM barrel-domain containing protein [Candidatus Hydrogenedentes bacterium]|nr:glycoside hydrolase family 2 TIM barrel-domain containing protein [Candidatus Hydrogenedentota bacterium]HPC17753.1 glycoside hydrolase family 2 TIM barrel-domain containing protein [Candidatus Hydrogenedentota bacterium]HRT20141.1 glycoside hydrolase family 2 TIM barrel-domain containing protein [Candidatus Hydrogenedentota bacterium]HRT66688.1 glycoside hydrolase family 2 TIM barrel-domain containing protein [Candidatus Hydrogenedentota bacterium]